VTHTHAVEPYNQWGFTNDIWAVGMIGLKKWSWKVWSWTSLCCIQHVSARCFTERQNYYPQCVC